MNAERSCCATSARTDRPTTAGRDGSVAAGHDATHVPKEAVGGYYAFEADDLDAAIELASLLALLKP